MTGAPSRKIRGVLLDIDGTLLTSNRAHAEAFSDVFRAAGYDITADEVEPLVGMGGDKLLPQLTGLESDQGKGKELAEAKKERFTSHYLRQLRPTRGARQLVERLLAAGLTVVVATSAGGDEAETLLRQAGVEDLLTETTSSSDAENSKPDPDIIVAALRKGELAPAEAVMIGDTPYDVEASARAGVPCIALRSGGWSDDALRGALAVFDDPADLVAHLDELPFADSLTGTST